MNSAHSLVQTLLNAGVDTCFANPGTSEMHFVAALDTTPGMRCVLGLQENVVTGMADGYFRVAERPACTLLHCGPGLANGWANLHNARRSRSGIVNLVGDQATWHRPLDAPLTADTEGLARAVSAWVRTSASAAEVGRDGAADQAPWQPGSPPVVVIGAGLAGAACALGLSMAGVPTLVLDRAAQPAQGASGNPAGLFHGVLHPEDGAHARLGRAAAWMAQRHYGPSSKQVSLRGRHRACFGCSKTRAQGSFKP